MSVRARLRCRACRLAVKSFDRGITVKWRGVTGGSGVQWVKTIIA